jgi:hypothetical protein
MLNVLYDFIKQNVLNNVYLGLPDILLVAILVSGCMFIYNKLIVNTKIKMKDIQIKNMKDAFTEHKKDIDRRVEEKFITGISQTTGLIETIQSERKHYVSAIEALTEKISTWEDRYDRHISGEDSNYSKINKTLETINKHLENARIARVNVKKAKLEFVIQRLDETANVTFKGAFNNACKNCDGTKCVYLEKFKRIAADRIVKSKEYWINHNVPNDILNVLDNVNEILLPKVPSIYVPIITSVCCDDECKGIDMDMKRKIIRKNITTVINNINADWRNAITERVYINE